MAQSLVRGAGLICDIVFVNPFEGFRWISTFAAVVGLIARQQHLGSEVDIRPGCFSHYFDAIAQTRSDCERPTGSTVIRNALIPL